jgi:hypothetical protein
MAGAPYQIKCDWTDDETPVIPLELTNLDGSVLSTSGVTFEYVIRDSCGSKVATLAIGSGITLNAGTGLLSITLPTLAVGRYSHGCRFLSGGAYTQLFDGDVVITEGNF